MVRLRRFNFVKKMSKAISTFDVYPPSAAPEATRVHLFHAKQIPSGDSQSLVLWARILYY